MAQDFGHPALTYPACNPFGGGKAMLKPRDASDDLKWLLGGKGANLARMGDIGLCVPPGFTLTTEVCRLYEQEGSQLPEFVWQQVLDGVTHVEGATGSSFGSAEHPLLISVRSGAAISMPGMMDTVLNLGLNDETVEGLAAKTNNPRFAFDSYRRFLDMFGDVVMNIPHNDFEVELKLLKTSVGVKEDSELTTEQLKHVVHLYKMVYKRHGLSFPTEPLDQLRQSICAVFNSWQSDRARTYMKVQNITGLLGTAVNVQAMAFGNMGNTSCTGVLFTRDPNTGENYLFGEYLTNAQGEDVVAGIRTPKPISQLESEMKEVYDELRNNCDILEKNLKDMQDVEFTVQEGKLYMLQTRNGKRGGKAAVRIAVEFCQAGLINRQEALHLVTPAHLDIMLHPQFDNEKSEGYKSAVVGKGLPASPGAAVGTVCFTTERAEALHAAGTPAILVRDETSPEDVAGMYAATGILTARGGMTSHAAVVARGWGKPCIVGLGELDIDESRHIATLSHHIIREGDTISLNGATGEVLLGTQPMSPPAMEGTLSTFMEWVDEFRTMDVLANADTPEGAAEARKQGATGIGLCRTEHMFFDYINDVRRMILAPTEKAKSAAINRLLPLQQRDFEGIFEAMDGLPVTIRLLDPPLHEFLPPQADDEVANAVGLSVAECQASIDRMREANPMLGLRGCRLGITTPDIVRMQTRAILVAALEVQSRGKTAIPKIMVPLVGSLREYTHQQSLIRETADAVFAERGETINYHLGTMIETPRAALIADQIAASGAEFFSFGTNDLTQMTFGFSRDDVGSFLPVYLAQNIVPHDPFQVIDQEGVGALVKQASDLGKAARPGLKCGVCGEHGGDPSSVLFFASLGHDYVSCSTFRVPLARLAAAQGALKK